MPRRRGAAPGRAMGRARRTRRRRRRRRVMLVGGYAELEQAMSELNIEKQTVTSDDMEQGGAPAAPEPAAAPADSSSDYLAELEKLASLRDAGIRVRFEEASDPRTRLRFHNCPAGEGTPDREYEIPEDCHG